MAPGGAPTPTAPVELAARTFTRGDVDRTWRRVSFTSLVRDAGGARQRPRPAPTRPATSTPAPSPTTPSSPGGAGTGEPPAPGPGGTARRRPARVVPARCRTGDLPPRRPRARRPRRPRRRRDGGPAARDARTASRRRCRAPPDGARGLRAAVLTPLGPVGGDARLADLGVGTASTSSASSSRSAAGTPPTARRSPSARSPTGSQTSSDPLVAGYAERLRDPALRGKVRGFLNGSIDLLARLPDGRFLVADYKSNWLGDRATGRSVVDDYHPGCARRGDARPPLRAAGGALPRRHPPLPALARPRVRLRPHVAGGATCSCGDGRTRHAAR
jgi:exodeoxyribonuclease V beta subunit